MDRQEDQSGQQLGLALFTQLWGSHETPGDAAAWLSRQLTEPLNDEASALVGSLSGLALAFARAWSEADPAIDVSEVVQRAGLALAQEGQL